MRLDPNPLFRRMIMPWYDGTPLCWALLLAMVVVALFGWSGISVASQNPAYNDFLWLPWTLLVLSLFVGQSVLRRLVRRHLQQKEDDHP